MALKERIERTDRVKVWCGELPVESLYTAGGAGERFLRTLKDKGEFWGTLCEDCGMVYVPGRVFCERCLRRLEKWVKVGNAGILVSWTVVHVGIDGNRLDRPEIIGLIKLDGASTMLVHRIGKVDPAALRFGMRVSAVLKPRAERKGAITDVLYFKPE